MADDYTVSLQLIDDQGRKAAQSDTWPLDGAAPTSTWQPGERYHEQRELSIGSGTVPGVYNLHLIAYHVVDGEIQSLPIRRKGRPSNLMIDLTHIQLTPVSK
jgi:hypothetical protein